MATPDDGEALGPEGLEGSDRDGRNVINHYYGQVNQINRAENCNFGVNNGNIVQNKEERGAPRALPEEQDGAESQLRETPIARRVLVPIPSSDEIFTLLNPLLDASHTRNRKVSPPNSACFPGTRESVLKDVRRWAKGTLGFPGDNPHIMWIYGYAGCGKSAIAQAVAERFAREGQLAASFFFFRGSGDRSNISRFATTIASQVASTISETRSSIEAAVKKNRGLVSTATATLTAQFQHLIYEPIGAMGTWRRVSASLRGRPYLIVLDGLDECENRDEITAFIKHMIEFFTRKPRTPLRFLITSRVESHIHQYLHTSNQVRLLDLVDHTSDSDIAAALDAALESEKGNRVLVCDRSWPPAEDKAKLVKHIGGSYIFMTTIVKLLFDPHSMNRLTPMERLPLILSTQPDFDGLYRSILEPSRDLPHFHDVLSALALAQEPLSITQIADLLAIDTAKVANVLVTLHAIMQVPGDDRTPITLWHTSLRDFLCTKGRAGEFLADHQGFAYTCILSIVHPVTSAISEYATRFAMFHWKECLRIEGERDWVDPSTVQALEDFLQHPFRGVTQVTGLEPPVTPTTRDKWPPLALAVYNKNWKAVRALAATKADLNVLFNEAQGGIACALHAACNYKQWDLVYLLLEKGADPNIVSCNIGNVFNDFTALAFAVRKNDAKLATRLLESGADPHLEGGFRGSAFKAAFNKDSLEMFNLLLDHGADPNLTDYANRTPLHLCALRGDEECARALLMHKADPNRQNTYGDTPLHLACYGGKEAVLGCLLEFKADASIKNKDGHTALQVAQRKWFERPWQRGIEILRQHGITE